MQTVYRIESGDWAATVAPQIAAHVVNLTFRGEDVLVPLTSKEQLEENPYLHGAPILLPANRTRDGKFTFAGKEYHLPINEPSTGCHLHGVIHEKPFEVVSHSGDSITLSYENTGECYPFPFRMTVTFTVSERGFAQHYVIENKAGADFPLTFALHTTFVEPDHFKTPIDRCQERDSERLLPTGRLTELSPLQRQFAEGSASRNVPVIGYYTAKGHTAQVGEYDYIVSDLFDHWVMYNGNGVSGFLCVEPQCGAVDGLNQPDGHFILKAGDTVEFDTLITRR